MKVIAIGPMYNEGERAVRVIQRFPAGVVDGLPGGGSAGNEDVSGFEGKLHEAETLG